MSPVKPGNPNQHRQQLFWIQTQTVKKVPPYFNLWSIFIYVSGRRQNNVGPKVSFHAPYGTWWAALRFLIHSNCSSPMHQSSYVAYKLCSLSSVLATEPKRNQTLEWEAKMILLQMFLPLMRSKVSTVTLPSDNRDKCLLRAQELEEDSRPGVLASAPPGTALLLHCV